MNALIPDAWAQATPGAGVEARRRGRGGDHRRPARAGHRCWRHLRDARDRRRRARQGAEGPDRAADAQGHPEERLNMLEYARWKYLLVAAVLLLAMLFALPNVFGEDPALQVERKDHNPVTVEASRAVESFLAQRHIRVDRSYIDGGRLMVRFANVPDQLAARDAVNEQYADAYRTALSFAPRTPELLRTLGLRPMPLGLDLRGGLYLLYQVDVGAAVSQALEGYAQDARRALAAANIPVKDLTTLATDSGGRPNATRI